jgi:hypothetical protein
VFLADCAREIRSGKQREAEGMVKRTGVRASKSNLNSGYKSMGFGAIKKQG